MTLIFVDVCTAYFRAGLAPDSVLSIMSIVSVHRYPTESITSHARQRFLIILRRSQILDPECDFHVRNRNSRYEEPSEVTDTTLEFGWLQEIINKLSATGCIQLMVQLFLRDDLSGPAMTAILTPLSKPAQLYRPEPMRHWLDPCVQKALNFVNGKLPRGILRSLLFRGSVRYLIFPIAALTDADLRTKNISYLPELVNALRQLCAFLWPDQLQEFTEISMKVILRLLRSSHFAARTCGFKEVRVSNTCQLWQTCQSIQS